MQTEGYKEAIAELSNKLDNSESLQLKKNSLALFDNKGDSFNIKIDVNIYTRLQQVSLDNQVSLYSILLTSLYHVLSVYAGGQVNFPIGLTVSNRPFELNDVIGPFISTLPLIPNYSPDETFINNIKNVHREIVYLNEYHQINLGMLVEYLTPGKSIADLMHVMFTMHNFKHENTNLHQENYDLIKVKDTAEQFGISITASERDNEILFNISYAKNLYQLDYIKAIFDCFIALLSKIDSTILEKQSSDLNLLSEEEYKKIIYDWNKVEQSYPNNKTIHELFEEQVEKSPDRIAVVHQDKKITYRELNNKANQLANFLKDMHNIKPGTLIILCLDRSELMIVAILGVLKTGGAYVPIDPNYPEERICHILNDCESNIILTNEQYYQKIKNLSYIEDNHLAALPTTTQAYIYPIDREDFVEKTLLQSLQNTNVTISNTNLAYVIYTSGTTGNPKGVMQIHNNVCRLFIATEKLFNFDHNDVWTLFHSYIFDFSVWEIWGALIYGGKLIIPTCQQIRDSDFFYELCRKEGVTILNQTPGAFYQLMDIANDKNHQNKLNNLKYIIFGGEALNMPQLKPWFINYNLSKPILINMYGITEITVHATYKLIKETELNGGSNIGKTLDDLTSYVLSTNLMPLPIGAIGELYIGGQGLAIGYLNNEQLTIERFITNPFQTEEEKSLGINGRIYKTGDLVRWMSDGCLEYIGRNDFQVKIRGYRIELGEIESVLSSYPGIRRSIVIVNECKDGGNMLTISKYLIAYYVSTVRLNNDEIMAYLRTKLPDYMLPNWLVPIEFLPLTINGKIDKKLLPTPEFNHRIQS